MGPMVPEPEEARQACASRVLSRGARASPLQCSASASPAYPRDGHAGRGSRRADIRLTRRTGDAGWCHSRSLTDGWRPGRARQAGRSGARWALVWAREGSGSWDARRSAASAPRDCWVRPACMPDPGTWAAAVPAKQRPASARVIPLFHVMVCSSPESSGRSPEREKGHRPCQTPHSGKRRQWLRDWRAERPSRAARSARRVNATR